MSHALNTSAPGFNLNNHKTDFVTFYSVRFWQIGGGNTRYKTVIWEFYMNEFVSRSEDVFSVKIIPLLFFFRTNNVSGGVWLQYTKNVAVPLHL